MIIDCGVKLEMQRKGTKPTSRCKGVRMHVTWGEIRALDLKDGAALPKNCPGVRELMFVRVHTSPACGENIYAVMCQGSVLTWLRLSTGTVGAAFGSGVEVAGGRPFFMLSLQIFADALRMTSKAHENGSRQIAAKCVPGMVCMHAFPVCRFVSDCRAYCLPNIAFPFHVSTISQH